MAGLVAKRYGTAIFELAKEKDAVEALETEIILLKETFEKLDLEEFLGHPKISLAEKVRVLEASLAEKISHDLMGLLILMVEKGRYLHIHEVFEEALEQIDIYRGRAKAYISSADPLTHEQMDKLIHQLSRQTHKEIIPVYEVDPGLIGGLVIRIGDRIVDNSIRGHLHVMNRELLATKIENQEGGVTSV